MRIDDVYVYLSVFYIEGQLDDIVHVLNEDFREPVQYETNRNLFAKLSIDLGPVVEYVKCEVLFLWVRYNIAVTSASKRDIVHQKISILATKRCLKNIIYLTIKERRDFLSS